MFNYISLCLLSLIAISSCNTDAENTTFVATNEMQEIKDGQKVPAGLHYRINLTTGKKEAKLLEDDAKDPKNNNDNHLMIKNQIIKSSGLTDKSIKELKDKFKQEQSDQKKREKLMKSVTAETNFVTIKSLIQNAMEFKKSDDHSRDYIKILESCSILVHQIDYAIFFIENGGIDYIILPSIANQTLMAVRIKSMRLVGALAQNNLFAQKKVYEKNIANYLCHALLSSVDNEELSTALHALGSILRNFPEAQKDILSKLGMRALVKQIRLEKPLKLQIKTLTLLSDLIDEKKLETQHRPQSELNEIYKQIHFEDWLNSYKFCKRVEHLVSTNKNELSHEVEFLKFLIDAMTNFLFICKLEWANKNLPTYLYQIVTDIPEKTDYVFEIMQSVTEFFEKLNLNNLHDEL